MGNEVALVGSAGSGHIARPAGIRVNLVSPADLFPGGFWHHVEQTNPAVLQAASGYRSSGDSVGPRSRRSGGIPCQSAASFITGANLRVTAARSSRNSEAAADARFSRRAIAPHGDAGRRHIPLANHELRLASAGTASGDLS